LLKGEREKETERERKLIINNNNKENNKNKKQQLLFSSSSSPLLLEEHLESKIRIITAGMINHFGNKIRLLQNTENIETICDYISAMNTEINPSIFNKQSNIQVLCLLSEFHNNTKSYREMTRTDILTYMDSHRKTEEEDPNHKWIGTYNLRRIELLRFLSGCKILINVDPINYFLKVVCS
jgi:hypothetical protein